MAHNKSKETPEELEKKLEEATKDLTALEKELKKQEVRVHEIDEILQGKNGRLKTLLEEVKHRSKGKKTDVSQTKEEKKISVNQMNAKIDEAMKKVLYDTFRDERFLLTINEASSTQTGDAVRVEFEGDEVYWTVTDNYTFDLLLADAARYWDISPIDACLQDEKGALWPGDAYVAKELEAAGTSSIMLHMKQSAIVDDEELFIFEEEQEQQEELNENELAEQAESEMIIAKAKGDKFEMTAKQRAALHRKVYKELKIFLFFTALFTGLLYMRRVVENAYLVRDAMNTVFVGEEFGDFNEKSYEDIRTYDEFWTWVEGPFSSGVNEDTYYNDEEIPAEDMRIMYYNKRVGGIRMRQLRVAKDSCTLSRSTFQDDIQKDGTPRQRQFIDHCFAEYSTGTADTEAFGPGPNITGAGFEYTTAKENGLELSSTSGKVATYDGSGYVRDIQNMSLLEEDVAALKQNLWLDKQTRAILINFNVYNGNYNYYCQCQFLLEVTSGGIVVPSATFKIVNLESYTEEIYKDDWVVRARLAWEGVVYVYVLYYVVLFFMRMHKVRKITGRFSLFFRELWNIVDMVFFALMMISIMIRVYYMILPDRVNFDVFSEKYQEMSLIATLYAMAFTLDAISVLVCSWRLFKFFTLQRDLNLLWLTLVQAGQDLLIFTFMMLVMLEGFVIMSWNMFGMQARDFRSAMWSRITLMFILLGEFDVAPMQETNPTFGRAFFVMYVMFMFFIMLNIFLAILNDAYTVVHAKELWVEIEKKKTLSLREKFELRRAQWRDRKNIRKMKKIRKMQVKAQNERSKKLLKDAKKRARLEKSRGKAKKGKKGKGKKGKKDKKK